MGGLLLISQRFPQVPTETSCALSASPAPSGAPAARSRSSAPSGAAAASWSPVGLCTPCCLLSFCVVLLPSWALPECGVSATCFQIPQTSLSPTGSHRALGSPARNASSSKSPWILSFSTHPFLPSAPSVKPLSSPVSLCSGKRNPDRVSGSFGFSPSSTSARRPSCHLNFVNRKTEIHSGTQVPRLLNNRLGL